ncbi:1-acyl-sn-glycerol-3-phosphate acyltransferase [Rodentibacter sp. JRC1]|uniref:lysophospholipid acyltransferase family protein n=1 Tax=Rodentibacter TaxID=1960084 RepID=UPI001CFE543D|nr:lysophospholipid acyltransferase family protein [Rodentibacter sp. JRC1]GJI56061.1 1-acyl-sn-glycerol-3-phosphate acyltransferase [Rodentibacter sp. JRC1]
MAEKLNRLRRFFGTMFGFVLFAFAGVIFRIVLLPYTCNPQQNDLETQLKARRWVGIIWGYFVRYAQWSGVLEVNYHGFEKLGRTGQLIIANHPSLLDVVLIIAKESRLNCIVKQDLLNNPILVAPILASGFLPNTESEEVLEKSHHILQNEALLLFPEGTRTGWDGVVNLHRGAVSIGLRSANVITPVVIKMSPPNFKKGQPWYKIPVKKITYDLTVCDDIDPQTLLREASLPIASRRLKKQLEQLFNSHTQSI